MRNSRTGQSLIELVAGMAIGVAFFIVAGDVIAPSLAINKESTQVQFKTELASGLADNIRSWASGNWDNVLSLATGTTNIYYLNTATSPFTALSGLQSVVIGSTTYSYYFYLTDAYRDASGNPTTTVGTVYDPSIKMFTINASSSALPPTPALSLTFYLTRNQANVVTQTSWVGGSGQSTPVTLMGTSFYTDSNVSVSATGSITLATTTSNGTLDSATFDTGVASGTEPDSLIWQGSNPSNSGAEFQLAVSNNPAGPWNFQGPNGGSTYFNGSPNTPINLTATTGGYLFLEGYRYFRYRVTLFPDSTFTYSPMVNQVSIVWSP